MTAHHIIRIIALMIGLQCCGSFKHFSLTTASFSSFSSSLSTFSLSSLYALNDNIKIIDSTTDTINDPVSLSTYLRRAVLSLIGKFTSDDGKYVDYSTMKSSDEFAKFVQYSLILPTFSIDRLLLLSDEQRLSFFINLYNVLILHANCIIGFPENTIESRTDFFRGKTGALYNIGGYDFSPDDIEHGILRANHAHPSGQSEGKFFADSDPRGKLALRKLDPRIHFILNCGANSCPPLRVCGDDPEKVLKSAAVSYLLSQEIKIDFNKKTLKMPKLLLWYGKDFGNTIGDRLEKILTMLPEEKTESIRRLIQDNDIDSYTVDYDSYDWTNNNVK